MKYQLFPNLTADEFEALTADIKARGVMVPVEVDENGDILDGHHRVMIADSLGVEYPTIVREGWTEDQKLVHVVALNAHRRQLTATERAEVVATLRKTKLSTRAIAKAVGVDPRTVRRDLSGGAFAPPSAPGPVASITGTDGKSYPARQPFRPRLDPLPYHESPETASLQAAAAVIGKDPDVIQADAEYRVSLLLRDLTRARNAANPEKWADRLIPEDVETFRIELNSFERWIADWRTALSRPLRMVNGGKS